MADPVRAGLAGAALAGCLAFLAVAAAPRQGGLVLETARHAPQVPAPDSPSASPSLPAAGPGYVIDYSGLCLDARGAFGTATAPVPLQVWACGAAGSVDQLFIYDPDAQHLVYEGSNGQLCASDRGMGVQVLLTGCSGDASETVTRGQYSNEYVFTDSGRVLDVRAAGTRSGTPVQTWTGLDDRAQQFMVPFPVPS